MLKGFFISQYIISILLIAILVSSCVNDCKNTSIIVLNRSGKNIDSMFITTRSDYKKNNPDKISLRNKDSCMFNTNKMNITGEGDIVLSFQFSNDSVENIKYFGYYTNGCFSENKITLRIYDSIVDVN